MATPNTTYIVCFELKNASLLSGVNAYLKSFPSYCPINDGCWAVQSSKTPLQITNELMGKVGPNDSVFVVRSGTAGAWRLSYAGTAHSDWLKNNL